MAIHLIMPMGGAGSRFYKNGFMVPKPLIEINERPFLFWATESIAKKTECRDITFVVLQDHIDHFDIDKVIMTYYPNANIEVIPDVLPGPVLTCLQGIKSIDDDLPVLFNDCDHMFSAGSFFSVCDDGLWPCDGTLITFESNQPQFSYVRYGVDGEIIGTIEKTVVSTHAICGAYGFRNAQIFKDMTEEYLQKCSYSEYFVSGVYNVMCEHGLKVKDYLSEWHVTFGTPEEYEEAKDSAHFQELLVR